MEYRDANRFRSGRRKRPTGVLGMAFPSVALLFPDGFSGNRHRALHLCRFPRLFPPFAWHDYCPSKQGRKSSRTIVHSDRDSLGNNRAIEESAIQRYPVTPPLDHTINVSSA